MICGKLSQGFYGGEQAETDKTAREDALHMPMSPVIPYFTLIYVYVYVLFMNALCPSADVYGHDRGREICDWKWENGK